MGGPSGSHAAKNSRIGRRLERHSPERLTLLFVGEQDSGRNTCNSSPYSRDVNKNAERRVGDRNVDHTRCGDWLAGQRTLPAVAVVELIVCPTVACKGVGTQQKKSRDQLERPKPLTAPCL